MYLLQFYSAIKIIYSMLILEKWGHPFYDFFFFLNIVLELKEAIVTDRETV